MADAGMEGFRVWGYSSKRFGGAFYTMPCIAQYFSVFGIYLEMTRKEKKVTWKEAVFSKNQGRLI